MNSVYYSRLIEEVINKSEANSWEEAVKEWEDSDCIEDENQKTSCICGKENLKYLFTIKNKYNNKILFPIGSSCIKKFNRADLNEKTLIKEKLFKLYHAVNDNRYIQLDSKYFSRKLITYLFEQGAFIPSTYNDQNGENDYHFINKMYNMRNLPSKKQQGKINAIIINSIIPYLKKQLNK